MRIWIILLFIPLMAQADFLGTKLSYAIPTFQFQLSSDTETITFEPNPLSEVALQFIGPQYAFGLQFSGEREEDKDFLESGYSDFLISYYTPHFIVDLFYRGFEDFYVLDDLEEITESNKEVVAGSEIGAQVLFMDHANIFEFHGDYVFSPKTNYDFFIQLRFAHSELEGEDEIIPSKYAQDFTKISQLKKFTLDTFEGQLGISGLYAFDAFYFNSYLSLGPAFESYLLEGESKESVNLISPVGQAFMGVAYYSGSMQIGLRAQGRKSLSQLNGVDFSQTYMSQYIYYLMFF